MITAILTAFVQTILNMFLKGSVQIASTILSVITVLSDSGENANPLEALIHIIQPDESFGIDTWGGMNVAGVLYTMTKAVVILLFALEVYRCWISQFNGQNSENMFSVVVRTAVVGVLLFLLYGNGTTVAISKNNLLLNGADNNRTFLGLLNQLFLFPVQAILPRVNEMMEATSSGIGGITAPSFDITDGIGIIIISGGILASVISGAISILERTVTIVIYLLLGPIAIAFYTSKITAQATIEWLKGLVIQYLVLDISIIVWGLAIGKLQEFFNDIFVQIDISTLTNIWTAEKYIAGIRSGAVAIVLFSIAGNTEEIFGSLGFKMMSGLDSARIIGGGLNTAMSAVRTASMAKGTVGKVTGAGIKAASALASGTAVGSAVSLRANDFLAKHPGVSSFVDFAKNRKPGTTYAAANEKDKNVQASVPATQMGDKKAYTPGKPATFENACNLAANAEKAMENNGSPVGDVADSDYRGTAGAIAEACRTGAPTIPVADSIEQFNMSPEELEAAKKAGADIPSFENEVSASTAGVAISKLADSTNGHLTENEKSAKADAIGSVFADDSKPIMTTAETSSGVSVPVMFAKDKNGDYAITSGGASMEDIASIQLPVADKDGNMRIENVEVGKMDAYSRDFVTKREGDNAVQYFGGRSSANEINCTAGFNQNSVMKVNFKNDDNKNVDFLNNQRLFEKTNNSASVANKKVQSHGK